MSKPKLIVVAVALAAALAVFGAVFSYVANSDPFGSDQQLDLGLKLLDEGRWDIADRLARDLDQAHEIDQMRKPVWHFIRGVAGVLRTEDKLDSPINRGALWDSIYHLLESKKTGFPIGYRGQGAYFLGHCYFHTYAWDEAIASLTEAIEAWPERRSDALNMMVIAALRQSPPNIELAKTHLEKWGAIPGLSDSEKNRISLRRAQLAFTEGDWASCDAALSKVTAESAESFEARFWLGYWKLQRASSLTTTEPDESRIQLLNEALSEFQKLTLLAGTPPVIRRQTIFLSGKALRRLNRLEESLSVFSGVRQRNPQSAESIASGVEEAEIEISLSRFTVALETARHVTTNIGDLRLYDEYWLPLTELRSRLLEMGVQLKDSGKYDLAVKLAEYLPAIFADSGAVRLQAETFHDWAESLAAAASPTASFPDTSREIVHEKFAEAGKLYRKLSDIEAKTNEYPEILWQAIECYRKSDRVESANELLRVYLLSEKNSERPRGYLALAGNQLNAGSFQPALATLRKCLDDHPQHPACYEARLLSARALAELDRLGEANELLLQNLYDGKLHPDSQLWRDSLFELGETLYRQGDRLALEAEQPASSNAADSLEKLKLGQSEFLSAIQRLSEAVSRYETDERAQPALYAVGKSYSLAAKLPKRMLDSGEKPIESERKQLIQQRKSLLESALSGYRKLRDSLNRSQEQTVLSASHARLLRNCYFAEADTLFDLQRFDEAIVAYRNVGNRFLNQPESLEALVQISQCYRQLGQVDQAKRMLQQAEQVLSRIPTEYDSQFATLTRTSRDQWPNLLAWLKQL